MGRLGRMGQAGHLPLSCAFVACGQGECRYSDQDGVWIRLPARCHGCDGVLADMVDVSRGAQFDLETVNHWGKWGSAMA